MKQRLLWVNRGVTDALAKRNSRPGAFESVQDIRLHLADGKSSRVPHPEFVLAGREQLVVATELPHETPGELSIVPYEHIVRLEFLPRRTKKAA